MLKAYINHPDPHITAHFDSSCRSIQSHDKQDQRYLTLNIDTLTAELNKFKTKGYRFGTYPYNDMWVEIDFQDREFEFAVLEFVCKLLGKNYKPFSNLSPKIHC